MSAVTIVIPVRRLHALVLATAIIPIAIPVLMAPPLATFFEQSNTPGPVGWTFLGFLTLFFGVLPATVIVNGFVRSRRGATIVEVSKDGLRVRDRRAWRTHAIASFDAEDILDVDVSTHESSVASAKRATEQQVRQAYPGESSAIESRLERTVARLSRYVKGKGIVVKTRTGLTRFGEGLDDAEIRYLHAVIRRALAAL
jgi:hypothetical protein